MDDVVAFKIDIDNREARVCSWGRGNVSEVQEFCRRPKWPAKLSEHFIGVDDWGHNSGHIVAATPSLENWIGKTFAEFRSAARIT